MGIAQLVLLKMINLVRTNREVAFHHLCRCRSLVQLVLVQWCSDDVFHHMVSPAKQGVQI